MVRVLQIVGSLGHAGLEAVVMNYYRNMDTEQIQFDFVVNSQEKQKFDDEILSRGGKIYRLPSRIKTPHLYIKNLVNTIVKNNYKIIHIHQNSASMLLEAIAAKMCGVKTIIGHSHNTSCNILWQHYILKPLVNLFLTHRFACSKEAGVWVFGKTKRPIQIINNAIDSEKYLFDESIRNLYRKKFECEDKLVIGFVGRLHEQKNLFRFLDICKIIKNKNSKAVFLIVGDGDLKEQLVEYSSQKGISNDTLFLGRRNDISSLMMMFDVFLMTSIYEGLPVVKVEAQASGLPCVISNKVPSINLIDNLKIISLNESDQFWADEIISFFKKSKVFDRKSAVKSVTKNHYNISNEAHKLQSFYLLN